MTLKKVPRGLTQKLMNMSKSSKRILLLQIFFMVGHSMIWHFEIYAQTSEAVYLDQKDTAQNCYRIWIPRIPQGKLVVLLPGYAWKFK